ncbi:MAG: hypothetical protein QOE77_2349 [Blastocatellia bacterium]|jgi:hypothetical protein|nr:hypothetical protein [Blastocatellia bacterium]
MEKKTFLTFLGQGIAGYVVATYVIANGLMFYRPSSNNLFLLVLLPVQIFVAGIVGPITGAVVWLVGFLLKRRLNILARAALGIGLATLFPALIILCEGWDWQVLAVMFAWGLLLFLPSALLAGSRFHPLQRIVLGWSQTKAIHDFGSGMAFPPALLLRAISWFGLMESLLFLAYLVSCRMPWADAGFEENYFLIAIVATLYFAASILGSLSSSSQKALVLASALIVNVPPLILLINPPHYFDGERTVLLIVLAVLWVLWTLMVFGRLISSENKNGERRHRRLFPLTIWEIEIRHVLGQW